MRRFDRKLTVVAAACCGGALLCGAIIIIDETTTAYSRRPTLAEIPVDGQRAFGYLKAICDLGRRPSGSAGMRKQQAFLIEHFRKLGAKKIDQQKWTIRHPENGNPVDLVNLLVQWHPKRQNRVLLCAHYDTRPFPDEDPVNPRGTFIGANDGASGVAVLCELGNHLANLDTPYGVDFVFFDAEEFIFPQDRGEYFVGSIRFAEQYRAQPPKHRYVCAVLLDMVGDRELQIYKEKNSWTWTDSRPLVQDIWNTARRLQIREFRQRVGHEIRDDHLPLHNIAGIPACDIIDFDYPRRGRNYWHTSADTPDKCSPLSLAKVGWVVLEWLRHVNPTLLLID